MKYLQVLIVVLSLASAKVLVDLEFGARVVRNDRKGINLEVLATKKQEENVSKELVGNIWADCG